MKFLAEIIWFLLPAGFANMAPIFAKRLFPGWRSPIDGGRTVRGTRILGDHKTWRGIVTGLVISTGTYGIQIAAYKSLETIREISLLDYSVYPLWIGAVMGAGALGGDLMKSFFKRQMEIRPGQSWVPFDQVDWMVGTLIVMFPFVKIGFSFALTALAISVVLSLLFKWIGYLIHLNEAAI